MRRPRNRRRRPNWPRAVFLGVWHLGIVVALARTLAGMVMR